MITHPMLQMREPPPEIDVSKKALPKPPSIEGPLRIVVDPAATAGDKAVEMTYTVDKGVITVQSITEREAPADFKADDRLMVASKGMNHWIPRKILHGVALNRTLNDYRHPTAAELLEHWGEK